MLVDNHGFNSIGGLSRSLGSDGFGTQYRFRARRGARCSTATASLLPILPLDLAANAESLGAARIRVLTIDELRAALERAKNEQGTTS